VRRAGFSDRSLALAAHDWTRRAGLAGTAAPLVARVREPQDLPGTSRLLLSGARLGGACPV